MSKNGDRPNTRSFLRSLFPFGKSKKDGKQNVVTLESHSITPAIRREEKPQSVQNTVTEGKGESMNAETIPSNPLSVDPANTAVGDDTTPAVPAEMPEFAFVDHASFVNDLPGKGHDKVSITRLDDGSLLAVLCDGVGSLGNASAVFAEALTITLDDYFTRKFDPTNDSFVYWRMFVTQALQWSIEQISLDEGATTVIMVVIPENKQHMYIAWMGDGNLIYYTKDLTGYAKILYPHHNGTKQLTKAVSAKELIGEPSCLVMNPDPGYLILSSDGYTLLSAKYLRHFLMEVLRKDDLSEALYRWGNQNCCEEAVGKHHQQLDDQSIIVLRW